VADILGLRLSGFIAWWLWRTIYLAKLPTFEKKLRVALRWALDFAFRRDVTQHVTLHSLDRVGQLLANVRQHPLTSQSAPSTGDSAGDAGCRAGEREGLSASIPGAVLPGLRKQPASIF
jgi:NADH dehydrogenase